jgi:hypothetical protein
MTLLLPLELIETIIDHLVEAGDEAFDEDLDYFTSSLLKVLSLVCCSFVWLSIWVSIPRVYVLACKNICCAQKYW